MALPVQVQYWEYVENKRHNLKQEEISASQAESSRMQALAAQAQADVAKENLQFNKINAEANQLNAQTNAYNAQINAKNAETNRLNYQVNAANAVSNQMNAETQRLNYYETRRANDIQESQQSINWYNAETSRLNYELASVVDLGNMKVNQYNSETNRINAETNQFNATINQYNAETQRKEWSTHDYLAGAQWSNQTAQAAYSNIQTHFYPVVTTVNTGANALNAISNWGSTIISGFSKLSGTKPTKRNSSTIKGGNSNGKTKKNK